MLPADETTNLFRPSQIVYVTINETENRPRAPTYKTLVHPRFRKATTLSILFVVAFISLAALSAYLAFTVTRREPELFENYSFHISEGETPKAFLSAIQAANITYLEGGAPTRLCGESILWVFKKTTANNEGKEVTLSNTAMSVNITQGEITAAWFLKDNSGVIRPLIPSVSGSDHIIEPLGTGSPNKFSTYMFWEVISLNGTNNTLPSAHAAVANSHSHKAFGKGEISCHHEGPVAPSKIMVTRLINDQPTESPIPVATFEYIDGYTYVYLIKRPQPYVETGCGSVSVHAARISPEKLKEIDPLYEYWTGVGSGFSDEISMNQSPPIMTNWTRGSSVSVRWNQHLHRYCILVTKNGTSELHFARHPWSNRDAWTHPLRIKTGKDQDEEHISEAFLHPEMWKNGGETMVISLKGSKTHIPQIVRVTCKPHKHLKEEMM